MDPPVRTKPQAIDIAIRHSTGKSRRHHPAHFGHSVAIGVFQINNFRRSHNHHSTAPWGQRSRIVQAIRKDDSFICPTIPIQVPEPSHPATRLAIQHTQGVIPHLCCVTHPIRPKTDRHRIQNLRLCRKKFQFDRGIMVKRGEPATLISTCGPLRKREDDCEKGADTFASYHRKFYPSALRWQAPFHPVLIARRHLLSIQSFLGGTQKQPSSRVGCLCINLLKQPEPQKNRNQKPEKRIII